MRSASFAAATAALLVTVPVAAQRSHNRFEPTDLSLQPEGVAEIDVQAGIVTGEDGRRIFAPDYETSIGISSHAELELDGTYGLDRDLKAAALDNTLLAVRVQMFDVPDAPGSKSAWSGGVQAGPRIPTLPGTHGLGLEALFLVGRSTEHLHLFGQIGPLVDCAQSAPGLQTYRPLALEGGFDLDLDLDDRDAWSLKGELGVVKFFSLDRDQIHGTLGPALNVTRSLEISLVGVVGLLAGGDRLGLLLGADTHFKVF